MPVFKSMADFTEALGDAVVEADESLQINLGSHEPNKPKRANKYNAQSIIVNGVRFDSQAEYRRYCELAMMEDAGEISGLKPHPKFELVPAFTAHEHKYRAITYTADFEYMRDGVRVIEDVKGGKATATRDFIMRWKLLAYSLRDEKNVSMEIISK